MQVLSSIDTGVYARYNVSGDVRVRVAEVCAQRGDAMLNALFFDQCSKAGRTLLGTGESEARSCTRVCVVMVCPLPHSRPWSR